jgi:serine protease
VDYALPVAPSPDFSLARFVLPRDFTLNPISPSPVVIDTDGHGTHVAGTVGEDTNNGVGLAGIAFNVRIMPLKACQSLWDVQFEMSAAGIPGFVPSDADGCSTSSTSAAIRFAADNGADVLNYSVGGTNQNLVVRSAMEYAVARGVFIAMSNGNEFDDGNPVTFPASYAPLIDGAVSVAATNRSDQHAFYSTTGNFTEIAAPGGDGSGSVWQVTVRPSDVAPPPGLLFPRADRYLEVGIIGTSMASPHVAGVAALLHSRGITDPAQIERLLRGSALDLGSLGQDNTFGSGRIRPLVTVIGLGISR